MLITAPIDHHDATLLSEITALADDAEYLDWLAHHAGELAEQAEAEAAVESGCWAW